MDRRGSPSAARAVAATLCTFDDGTGPALYVAGNFAVPGLARSWACTAERRGVDASARRSLAMYSRPRRARRRNRTKALRRRNVHAAGQRATAIARWDGANWERQRGCDVVRARLRLARRRIALSCLRPAASPSPAEPRSPAWHVGTDRAGPCSRLRATRSRRRSASCGTTAPARVCA